MYSLHMRYIDMTPDQLRDAYRSYQGTAYRWSQLAAPRRRDGGRSADGMGRAMREIEFIENVARKRSIKL